MKITDDYEIPKTYEQGYNDAINEVIKCLNDLQKDVTSFQRVRIRAVLWALEQAFEELRK